jgi:oxaloacetate decarboxylase gamma subunit
MQEVSMVGEALKFMLLGMGIVFSFLVMMMYALKFQAKVIAKLFPESDEKPKSKGWQPDTVVDNKDDAQIAAIVAAIQHHKNLKG